GVPLHPDHAVGWNSAHQHFAKDHPKGIYVASRVSSLAGKFFWCEVIRRPHSLRHARKCNASGADHACCSEVKQLHVIVGADHDVLGSQIAMKNSMSLYVVQHVANI